MSAGEITDNFIFMSQDGHMTVVCMCNELGFPPNFGQQVDEVFTTTIKPTISEAKGGTTPATTL